MSEFQNNSEHEPQIDYEDEYLRRRAENSLPLTDRSLLEYCARFGFEPEDLRDKIILDVGSGRKETFSKQAAEYGAIVYSISPSLKKWVARKFVKGLILPDKKWQRKSVAAKAQNIPFADESFDIVTALWSVPVYNVFSDMHQSIKEMLRVLKPDGKLYISPKHFTLDLVEFLKSNYKIDRDDNGVLIISKNVGSKE